MLGVQMLGDSKVVVREFPDPVPKDGEVLVRILASGLCGSELSLYRRPGGHPFNGGHEAVGEVVEANHCRRLRPGDRVGIHAIQGCGNCRWCRAGKYTFCSQKTLIPGTHAELVAVPEHVCLPLPEPIPDDAAVLLAGDGLGVPYHAAKYLGTVGGDMIVVLGCGPIGLGHVLVHNFYGAEIIALDPIHLRRELATELGADHTLNPDTDDLLAGVKERTNGALATACIEAVGKPETVKLALQLVGNAGTVLVCGEQGEVPIHVGDELIRRDITLRGTWFYHYYEFDEMLDLYARGLWVEKLITDRFPLTEADTAFAKFASGQTGKVILLPSADDRRSTDSRPVEP